MALISEWMQQCEQKVLDDAGIVREAIFRQLTSHSPVSRREPEIDQGPTVS